VDDDDQQKLFTRINVGRRGTISPSLGEVYQISLVSI
jgi:hypothetical protein